jgi:sporulation protein YlmC with PRC-barrel domain
MTRSIIIACALAIGSSLGLAEEQLSTQSQSSASTTPSPQTQPQEMRLFDSSLIENKKVMDQDGKDMGKLERLLIDSDSGRVRFIIVQVDKEWSLNDPEVIIPWGTLQISRIGDKDYALKIDATRDKLMNAPRFDKKLVHQLTTREAGQPIYTYWGATWHDDVTMAKTGNPAAPSATPAADLTSPSTSSSPTATSPSSSQQNTTTPATTTDGSVGTQPLGNTGTTDSPKPDSKLGQPAQDQPKPQPPAETEYNSDEPDRTLGGNETD